MLKRLKRKKLRNILGSENGITLVETMMAILVFGTVLTSLLEVTAQSMTMGKRSELSYTAYNIAKNHIETLKALPFSNLTNAAESDILVDGLGVSDPEGVFKRTTTVTANYSGDANLVSLTVSVDYKIKNSFSGKPTTLTTVVFQYA